ncbi:MAG: CTP synthase (glutamine hydrolyzing) [Candidatus Marsarchaeota archaeon]|nr:CTP synthase (glutamine hydrolyzing) [Candidatus Marsarchaeota archaeon]MCL5412886.1 CTP synthase (glutamine hydrolyzing) [Candidatus Marsarchaeota archaeon]
MSTKYVVVLGSLMSGLGKGVVTSSILKLLDFHGYKVLPVKFDGYLNYDAGTMNPFQHGEVFVLDDKSEVDMDFGIYERFLNKNLTGDLSITGGKLFSAITSKERQGSYLGEDIQIIPHLTDDIIRRIEAIARSRKPDVLVIEVGGTVGDIENSYFIEAMRQLALRHDVAFVNLTYIPNLAAVSEQKTKPAQIGLRLLLQAGIRPDFLICRTSTKLLEATKEKLALFSNLKTDNIMDDPDLTTLYQLPLRLKEQGLDRLLIKKLDLPKKKEDMRKVSEWRNRVGRIINPTGGLNVAVVGKYTSMRDSYASVKEALIHAGSAENTQINIRWVESSDYESKSPDYSKVDDIDAMVVTGGFGKRGIEGMINLIRYARERRMPYLGLCLGMQLMAVEYARNICGMEDANSSEFNGNSKYKVIDLLPWQKRVRNKGGTMRLGAQECRIVERKSYTFDAYKKNMISERHRHRYEFNNKYLKALKSKGLRFTGFTRDRKLVEFIEWPQGFGIGTQSHPELRSRLESPAPTFVELVRAAKKRHSGLMQVENKLK